ncbi:lytic murein transglycosylase [Acidovorax sp. 106]|uniref:lytic murein transglycosylase n=1 Tax=Acidovorax sp. 106 TaxID=2135637 RepID=UPI000EB38706|nr:lytic murein transglycosylase [Acidovorax sp. 106]RLJ39911.1 lytic murein transglycosylase [Acidovorax sp. 106]
MHRTPPTSLTSQANGRSHPARLGWAALACALAFTQALTGCASGPGSAPALATKPATAATTATPPAPAPTQAAAQPPSPAAAPLNAADAEHAQGFARWRDAFAPQALAAGIRPQTVRDVLGQAQWQPRVIELDRSQPEFNRTPWAYLDSAVSRQRVVQGQAQMAAHRAPLEAAAHRYGVPASVLTAFWGIESNYGGNFGSFRAVDALATLAYEGRRQAWAQSELLAALRIIDLGDIAPEAMVGSWAGAMGHTQFIPSVFLAHAVDADGDGRRDIWGSIPDVLASTAKFVAAEGWQPRETWGTEVRLPSGFDHARAELTVRQSTAQWAAEGLQAVSGGPLPDLASASVLEPAGARGPAFLVGQNFRTILRYNNSTSYALAVALLAQRLDGGPGVVADWPRDLQPLSREQTRQLQTALNARGFDTGTPDGVQGPATRAGLRKYQQSQGLVADGYPTLEVLQGLVNGTPAK